MVIIAIRVVSIALLAFGFWELGNTLHLADQHYWHYLAEANANPPPISVDGVPVDDPIKYLTERGCYGGAITVIGLGFGFIARRVSSKTV